MADAVDADHEGPLQPRGSVPETGPSPRRRRPDRQNEEDVDRNEDQKEPVPVNGHQQELEGHNQEERPSERPMVAEPRRRERNELPERRNDVRANITIVPTPPVATARAKMAVIPTRPARGH